ncbi:LamG domain-containing protein, partial [Planctomycetota bacterium]
ELGDFAAAVRHQHKALDLLPQRRSTKSTLEVRAKLKLYQEERPYHRQSLSVKEIVACWAFDQVEGRRVLDSSGNNLHAELVGDARIVSDPQRGNVLSLDGNGDLVNCGNNVKFHITGAMTVSAWVRADTLDKECQAIVTKGDTSWRLQRSGALDAIAFHCTGAASASPNTGGGVSHWGVDGIDNVNDGKWHHAVAVYDTHRMYLYIDGGLDQTRDAPEYICTNDFPVLIGENAEMPGRHWNGLIDDVRIYNYALNLEEIQNVFKSKEQLTQNELIAPLQP